jgi:hypothetical protein
MTTVMFVKKDIWEICKKTMKTHCLVLPVAIVMLLFAGCSPYQYYAIQSDQVSMNKYHTFAWLPPADTTKNIKISDITDDRIRESITAILESKGLVLRAPQPDLLVRYTVDVNERVKAFNDPVYVYNYHNRYPQVVRYHDHRYFYYPYNAPFPVYIGANIVPVPYKEGTLIIDLIDRGSRKVIWRGYAIGEVADPEKAVKDIPVVVAGILNKLVLQPVNLKPTSHKPSN